VRCLSKWARHIAIRLEGGERGKSCCSPNAGKAAPASRRRSTIPGCLAWQWLDSSPRRAPPLQESAVCRPMALGMRGARAVQPWLAWSHAQAHKQDYLADRARHFVAGSELPSEVPESSFAADWSDAALEQAHTFVTRRMSRAGAKPGLAL
jgi:hypothetical protein